MKKRFGKYLWLLFWGFLKLSSAQAEEVRHFGEETILGSQPFWTWVQTKHNAVTAVGISFKADALQDLPQEHTTIELDLPKGIDTRPFKHFAVDWEPEGHEPDPIYGFPHFDFHFYMITSEKRQEITCQGADESICLKQPVAKAIPPDYISTPAGVPQMGWHWVDSKSPEFQGQNFTSTLVHGYYDGNLIFIEPMVTLAFLQSKPQFHAKIKQPEIYPQNGFYPKKYAVKFRSVQDEYDIVLYKMVYRKK